VPYGLVFALALGAISGVPMPATAAVVTVSGLVLGRGWVAENDLIAVLRLPAETVDGLWARVRAG
jgi:opine dehydrogenase